MIIFQPDLLHIILAAVLVAFFIVMLLIMCNGFSWTADEVIN